MRKLILAPAILAVSVAAFAQNPAARRASKPDLVEATAGEATYLRYCAACHGRSLLGDGAVASGLVNVPTDLTTLSARNAGNFPYERVAAIIDGSKTSRIHGTPEMPVWGEIFAARTGKEGASAEAAVRQITHFVWSRQAKSTPAPAPAKK